MYRLCILLVALICAACSNVSSTKGDPVPATHGGIAAPEIRVTTVRPRPSFVLFRERLRLSAENDYPSVLDGITGQGCVAFYKRGWLRECREYVIGNTPVDFKYYCLQRALKTVVAGELCNAARGELEDVALIGARYALLVAETVPPLPMRPNPTKHRMTAVHLAHRYLSEFHLRAYALPMFERLLAKQSEQAQDGDLVNARAFGIFTMSFANDYLGPEEVEAARALMRTSAPPRSTSVSGEQP